MPTGVFAEKEVCLLFAYFGLSIQPTLYGTPRLGCSLTDFRDACSPPISRVTASMRELNVSSRFGHHLSEPELAATQIDSRLYRSIPTWIDGFEMVDQGYNIICSVSRS